MVRSMLSLSLALGLAACSGGPGGSGTPPPAKLVSDNAGGTHDFGLVAVGESGGAHIWTVSNGGATAGGVPIVSRTGSGAFTHTTTCTAALAPGALCTVAITYLPAATGAQSATFSVDASPGGSVSLAVSGSGGFRLQVARLGTGAGTVTSTPAGITCGSDCTEVYPAGTSVTLQASTANGSGSVFQGWTGACAGPTRGCAATLTASTTAQARFTALTSNLVFVSSASYGANLGSAAAYDAACNALATAAGVNSAGGNGFVAWVSDSSSTAVARLGTARGWVLLDGRPFTDTLAGLTTNGVVWNPITVDENGVRMHYGEVLTGTRADGTVDATLDCAGWTSTAGNVKVGARGDGPGRWTDSGFSSCASAYYRLYCFQRTMTANLSAPPAVVGKRMWTTQSAPAAGGGLAAMDALCNTEKPAGVVTGRAFVATSTRSAASLLTAGESYVTVGGQLIATGADLQANVLPLRTGPWQRYDGAFKNHVSGNDIITTGASAVNAIGTLASTCSDWGSAAAASLHTRGIVTATDSRFFMLNSTYPCNTILPLVCVEQ